MKASQLLSDGVTKAKYGKIALFGDDRLTGCFKVAHGPTWAESLLERIDSWRGNAAMNDDLTLGEIWRDPPE